jgi:hypothetical protein
MDEPITVPCEIVFNRSNRQRSTINIRYKVIEEGEEDIDIPLFFRFQALYNFSILPNGDQQLKLANLHCIDQERSIYAHYLISVITVNVAGSSLRVTGGRLFNLNLMTSLAEQKGLLVT